MVRSLQHLLDVQNWSRFRYFLFLVYIRYAISLQAEGLLTYAMWSYFSRKLDHLQESYRKFKLIYPPGAAVFVWPWLPHSRRWAIFCWSEYLTQLKVFENLWTNLAFIARNPSYKVSYAAVCSFIYAKSMAALRSSANETWRGEWETSRPSYTRTRSWQTVLVTLSYQMIQLVRHFIALFSDKISDIRFDERGGRWGRQTSGHRCRRSNRNSR